MEAEQFQINSLPNMICNWRTSLKPQAVTWGEIIIIREHYQNQESAESIFTLQKDGVVLLYTTDTIQKKIS